MLKDKTDCQKPFQQEMLKQGRLEVNSQHEYLCNLSLPE